MKIVKFGGQSLENGQGINRVLHILEQKVQRKERFAVVVSARGKTTDQLLSLLNKAVANLPFQEELKQLEEAQLVPSPSIDFSEEFDKIERLLEGVSLLEDYSLKIKDLLLAQGELMSAKLLAHLLQEKGFSAEFTDARHLIKTDNRFGEAQPIDHLSRKNVREYFKKSDPNTIHVIPGFIASSIENDCTTLGRNGSNYTASLLANYLDAEELENYTHVDGLFTADPRLVKKAQRINQLSYSDANELAHVGTTLLHPKTITPLIEKEIPLRILNTFNEDTHGTVISAIEADSGIQSLTVMEDVALIKMDGRNLLGKSGVDARIFSALGAAEISVSLISQGSSERGVGVVVAAENGYAAKNVLDKEFASDIALDDVKEFEVIEDVSVLSIIGQEMSTFHEPYNALIRNQITPILFNNAITGKNVSLVLHKKDLHKALNVIHGEIFGMAKTINIALFGHGTVGGTLINQLLESAPSIFERKNIQLNIFAVANSRKVWLNADGIQSDWKEQLENSHIESSIQNVIEYARENHLENLVAIDNTASELFVENYHTLVENGFDLISSNKIANTLDYDSYEKLRRALKTHQKEYLYETNVGAGLPLIDTIRLLHLSGETITRVRGVFSGTLSYLFNTFSKEERSFSAILKEAVENGLTEPDPREDLNGNDVGRKLLILARELDLVNEYEDISIHNLVPEHLRNETLSSFLVRLEEMDEPYQKIKDAQEKDHVLRYVGDLSGDFSNYKADLKVSLVSVPEDSSLGQVKGADSIFEIYTESYGNRPIVIQGAGAGASVTARGVFGDLLKLAERK
jgi:aspartate kinase